MLLTLSAGFLSQRTLDLINAHQGRTWSAAMPDYFARKSLEQIHAASVAREQRPRSGLPPFVPAAAPIPQSFFWPDQRPECTQFVKDQLSCNAGWAFTNILTFAAVRCITGVDAAHTSYSFQEMISCDAHAYGCQHGFTSYGSDYLVKSGVSTERCVGYVSGLTGDSGKCPTRCDDGSRMPAKAKSDGEVKVVGEHSMLLQLLKAPLVAEIEIYEDFLYYASGVYEHTVGELIGFQGVQIVGWGAEGETRFWIVKNSWGEAWGEQGFFKIVRGANEAGIESQAFQSFWN
ncbi:Cathepsin B [Spironucleus salmonicida]|uniref:Cathepsin B n=1 Tax=Spironucleus salmonicida TaxID=348837 RepID=A0A9P8S112_9EUKA|nr:Cathepsin B [Spironucleus salmonicida]